MFFEAITEKLNRLKRVSLQDLVNEIINRKEFKELIISLNTEGQLFEKGVDSLNVSLGNYALTTIEGTASFLGKKDKGQRFDHITLKDTGEFYESWTVRAEGNSIIIDANPNKDGDNLFTEYGEDILGLTEDSLQILREKLLEELVPLLREKI